MKNIQKKFLQKNKNKILNNLKNKKIIKRFFLGLSNKSGKTLNGRLVVRGRGSFFSKQLFNNTSNNIKITSLVFYTRFIYKKFKNNNSVLIKLGDGSSCMIQNHNFNNIGILLFPEKVNILEYWHNIKTILNSKLGYKIFSLFLGNFIIAKSLGCFCSLIFRKNKTTFFLAPSGALMSTSVDSSCSIFIKDTLVTSQLSRASKILKIKGKRPLVRGTVKNSCDHPNGGRTRTLKRPKTPWGLPVLKKG